MNTRLSYRYTDKTFCRQYASIIVEGIITWEQIEPYLARQGAFIPGQIGLEDLQHRFALAGFDHPWHQILPVDLKPTELPPTSAFDAEELARRFASVNWTPDWRAAAMNAISAPQAAPPDAATRAVGTVAPKTPDEGLASRRWPAGVSTKKPPARRKV